KIEMKEKLIGRHQEQKILKQALSSTFAELVAVTGRRRVGKTYLVKKTYASNLKFVMTGIQNGTLEEQLQHFANSLNLQFQPDVPFKKADNWLNAFHELSMFLQKKNYKKKYVLFFDEMPWMATRRSGFVKAFGAFWNSWAAQQHLVIVICGSAVYWIIQKIVRDKGGLHNRITKRIQLMPFTLAETKDFLISQNINLTHYQIIQLYMAMGGIPHYLKEIVKG
ncbi:MAG: ATP-binding protein, partial [Bacteroidota bacterium]